MISRLIFLMSSRSGQPWAGFRTLWRQTHSVLHRLKCQNRLEAVVEEMCHASLSQCQSHWCPPPIQAREVSREAEFCIDGHKFMMIIKIQCCVGLP